MQYSVEEVARAVGGRLILGGPAAAILGVSTDSRQVRPGDLFFALPGERVDGHQFVGQAFEAGAAAAVVDQQRLHAIPTPSAVLIHVQDVVRALGDLAAYHRARHPVRVVGITGSVGKTSTKDLTAAVLAQRCRVLRNPGNWNNEIGVPLTLFRLGPETEVVVLELAMRGLGQIRRLAQIARPATGVITNIGITHMELLGSQDAIAAAKAELLEMLPDDGAGILNADDAYCAALTPKSPRVITFGISPEADVCGRILEPPGPHLSGASAATSTLSSPSVTEMEIWSHHFEVPPFRARVLSLGAHHLPNALAAAAVGLLHGLTPDQIAQGLETAEMSGMRMERIVTREGTVLLNDAYNASPDSMLSALEVLERTPGRRIAVLGDMFELGHLSEEAHYQVGERAGRARLDLLLTVGDRATGIAEGAVQAGMPATRVIRCADSAEAAETLRAALRSGDTVLVKASRGMRLETIVRELVDA